MGEAAASRPSSGGQGAGGDQFLLSWVNAEVEALEGSRSQQDEVALLGEYDLIDGEVILNTYDRETYAAGDALAVRHDEDKVLLFALDADLLQLGAGCPRVLASSVHERARHLDRPISVDDVCDLAGRVKCAHEFLGQVGLPPQDMFDVRALETWVFVQQFLHRMPATGRFAELWDAKGKNLAPNGLSEFRVDSRGALVSFR